MGIVVFGLITLGVPLLLVALPSVLLVFARGMRPSSRALWVLLSLLHVRYLKENLPQWKMIQDGLERILVGMRA